MTDELADELKAARDLIADPARWTQRAMARDSVGEGVMTTDPTAVCWCARGAIHKVGRGANGASALQSATRELFGYGATYTNDVLGHAAVMQGFALAIQNAEATP